MNTVFPPNCECECIVDSFCLECMWPKVSWVVLQITLNMISDLKKKKSGDSNCVCHQRSHSAYSSFTALIIQSPYWFDWFFSFFFIQGFTDYLMPNVMNLIFFPTCLVLSQRYMFNSVVTRKTQVSVCQTCT